MLDDVSGGYTRDFTQDGGPQAFIYDAAQNYAAQDIPLVVLGGKEYGSGSSRDWAAKGTSLLGVRAVITESFERIHRSNLIGMGVIPLQFPAGESAASLKLDGTEVFDITGIEELNEGKTPKTVHVTATKDGRHQGRVRRRGAHRHARRGRLLPQRRHPPVRATQHAQSRLVQASRGLLPSRSPKLTTEQPRQLSSSSRLARKPSAGQVPRIGVKANPSSPPGPSRPLCLWFRDVTTRRYRQDFPVKSDAEQSLVR